MEQISQRELRNDSGRIMRGVAEGRSYVVTSNGQVVAELRPLRRDRFVEAVAAVEMFRGAPRIDVTFRDDLDVHVDQDVTPRA